MSISPTLGGKLLSIPLYSTGGGVVGGVIDRCIMLYMYICAVYLSGVLWTGLETVVPGAQEVIKYLRQKVLTRA